jgi:hypothetical protein
VEVAPRADVAAAGRFLKGHSNGRFASLGDASRFSSKYGLNTALLYPLAYLDYSFAPYVNVSLDIPFVRMAASDPSEARQMQALIDWAPFSDFVATHPQVNDHDSLAVGFIRENSIRDLIVEKGRALPDAFRPLVLDSLALPTKSAVIYRLQ